MDARRGARPWSQGPAGRFSTLPISQVAPSHPGKPRLVPARKIIATGWGITTRPDDGRRVWLYRTFAASYAGELLFLFVKKKKKKRRVFISSGLRAGDGLGSQSAAYRRRCALQRGAENLTDEGLRPLARQGEGLTGGCRPRLPYRGFGNWGRPGNETLRSSSARQWEAGFSQGPPTQFIALYPWAVAAVVTQSAGDLSYTSFFLNGRARGRKKTNELFYLEASAMTFPNQGRGVTARFGPLGSFVEASSKTSSNSSRF